MYNDQNINTYQAGLAKSIEHSIAAGNVEDAEDCFVDAKERLLDVNNWNRYSDVTGIGFRLTDGHSRPVSRRAHKGDHIKIILPGIPDTHLCVTIQGLEYDDYPDLSMETFTMHMHLCAHSMNAQDDDNDDEGTFEGELIVERRGKSVYATFQSRNPALNYGRYTTTSNNWFGQTDAHWNALVKRFVA